MRREIIFCLLIISVFRITAQRSEILEIKLFDKEIIKGRLCLPNSTDTIKSVVIYVHGTGPNTFLNRRKFGNSELNYFDLFANEFTEKGVAFFTYNRRGVDTVNTPPFEKIDKEKFQKYLPENESKDVLSIIKKLKKDRRLKNSKIILLGWSEGSVIASMVAEKAKNKIDALFLAGYVHENMFDVIKWQYSGESSMIQVNQYFDKDNNSLISREEYETIDKKASGYRTNSLGNASFEILDANKDSSISSEDFKILISKNFQAIMEAYNRGDDDWIWNNYFHVTTVWLKAHEKLEPNKSRLLRINIPIYIFQGEDDMNCNAKWVYDLEQRFKEAHKTNLQVFIFKGHNHDLNYQMWIFQKEISKGLNKIFQMGSSF